MNISRRTFLKVLPIFTAVTVLTLPVSCSSVATNTDDIKDDVVYYSKMNVIENQLIKKLDTYDEKQVIDSLIIKNFLANDYLNESDYLIQFNYEQFENESSVKFDEWKTSVKKDITIKNTFKLKSISHIYGNWFLAEIKSYLVSNNIISSNSLIEIMYENKIYFDINDYCFKVSFKIKDSLQQNIEEIIQINIPIENIEFNFNVTDIIVFRKHDGNIIFQETKPIKLVGIVPLEFNRFDNSIFTNKIFVDEINDQKIYEQLGILDEQSNKASYSKMKQILKLNSVDVKNISLKRYSYYTYELEITLVGDDNVLWNDLTKGIKTLIIKNIFVSDKFASYINNIGTYQNTSIPTVQLEVFESHELDYSHLKFFLLDLSKNQIGEIIFSKLENYLILTNCYIDRIIEVNKINDSEKKFICYELKILINSNDDSAFIIDNEKDVKVNSVEIKIYLNFIGKN